MSSLFTNEAMPAAMGPSEAPGGDFVCAQHPKLRGKLSTRTLRVAGSPGGVTWVPQKLLISLLNDRF